MPIYDYKCPLCGHEEEVSLSIAKLNQLQVCPEHPIVAMKRQIGNNGGFRLIDNGSVSWGDGGYGANHGDITNFKEGRKVY